MSIARKLEEWQKAGLLTPEAAAAILAHEAHQSRPYLLYAIGGLGALTIVLGVVAIIASNWEDIPGGIKLAADLAVVAAVAVGVLAADRRGRAWLRELLIAIEVGLVLASIGLISQVYHLGGATWQALLAWAVLTAPLATRGRTRGLATAWVLGLHVTYYMALEPVYDALRDDALIAGLVGLPPLLCLVAATSPAIARWRPHYARALASLGWTGALTLATAGTFAFYDAPFSDPAGVLVGAAGAAALVGLLVARAARLVHGHPAAVGPLRALLVLLIALGYGPLALGADDLNLVGALAFLVLWAAVAWVAHATHNVRLLNLATAILGLRLLAVYFEVFGSLLDTGLGLITGGLVTIGITYLWARSRKGFAAHLAEEPPR